MPNYLRIVFMGTPAFSVPCLEALVDAGHNVVAVYSQPPRRAGRGKAVTPSPVHQRAEALGIAVHTPANFKADEDVEAFRNHNADVAVVVAYGLLLPVSILEAFPLGAVNVHASLLPRWRGAAPIQRAIEAGDEKSGVTIMQMDAGLDTGPMLMMRDSDLAADETGASLHDRLSDLGARTLVEALAQPTPWQATPQPEDGATYAKKLLKTEAALDWGQPAEILERRLRAFNPFPGCHFGFNDQRIKVLAADVSEQSDHAPGTVINESLTVACGTNSLELKKLQRPGKSAMDAADFQRGSKIPKGSLLV